MTIYAKVSEGNDLPTIEEIDKDIEATQKELDELIALSDNRLEKLTLLIEMRRKRLKIITLEATIESLKDMI